MLMIDGALALIEGMALIGSPCILPILPLILSTSLEGGKARPLGIIAGFIIAFSLFAFFSRGLIVALGINLDDIKYASLILLAFLGIIMISEILSEKFSEWTQGIANIGSSFSANNRGGFFAGLGVGALIGLIWTPCAGPILAAVLVQVIQQKSNIQSFMILMCFAIGAGIPMLLIAFAGRALIQRVGFFKAHAQKLRKILGVIILASVIFIATGSDVQVFIPEQHGEQRVHMIENNAGLINGLKSPYPAPDFSGIHAWLNSQPLTMSELKGKVVLVDFWTYSCINCVRTLPYVVGWDKKFKDKGLVIVGVHAPEFEFEKNVDNIKNAIHQYHIEYPVAVDSLLSTWSQFRNHYWPAQYLINKEGEVVYTHFGEGDDDVTEHNIEVLLGIKETVPMGKPLERVVFDDGQTPETYLGYHRAERLLADKVVRDELHNYQFAPVLTPNQWTLSGAWKVQDENILSGATGSALKFNFSARKVFLVMGNMTNKPIAVAIALNGRPVTTDAGKDVHQGVVMVDKYTLYELIDQHEFKNGVLDIKAHAPGLVLYAFTFG